MGNSGLTWENKTTSISRTTMSDRATENAEVEMQRRKCRTGKCRTKDLLSNGATRFRNHHDRGVGTGPPDPAAAGPII